MLAAAASIGLWPAQPAIDYAPGLVAAAGGALFGLGASINGACTFGTVARLGRGEISFFAMPAGFVAGAALLARIFDAPMRLAPSVGADRPSIVATMIVFFVGWELFRLTDSVRSPADALRRLASAEWHPSLAMAAIGLSSSVMMLAFAPWPYSALLLEFGVTRHVNDFLLRIALSALFLSGAVLAALLGGAFRFTAARRRDVIEKSIGGALMGAGAYLIPGGNDSLVLTGLPHLFAYAAIAYASMMVAIAISLIGRRRLKRRHAASSSILTL